MVKSDACSREFVSLAERLGNFGCGDLRTVIHVRNPADLSNWTLPVIEVLFIGMAVAAMAHAVRSLRRGDRVPMALWCASVIFLFTTEPELYFPGTFGLDHSVGLIWVHNVFTVQFMWDRLPLYIIAVYPAFPVLAWEIIRRAGVVARHGVVVCALCVAFVYQCFYEVFDQIGPQLKWWLWNPAASSNDPMIGGVPVSSAYGMAVAGPFALALLVGLLFGSNKSLSRQSIVLRTVVAGVGTPIGVALLQVPMSSLKGHDHAHTRGIMMVGVTIAVAVVAAIVMLQSWRATAGRDPAPHASSYVTWTGGIYIVVLIGLWAYALPDTLSAKHGVTDTGTLAGNIPYAVVAMLGTIGVWLLATTRRTPAPVPDPVVADGVRTPA